MNIQRKTPLLRALLASLAALCMAVSAFAAFDSAADAAYNDGWQNGDNGGTGWNPWRITGAGHGLGDSNTNGSLLGPGINTAGRSWALATPTGTSGFIRRNLVTPLGLGDTMFFEFDTSTSADFYIMQGASNKLNVFMQAGDLTFFDASGLTSTGLGVSDRGVRMEVTRLSLTQTQFKVIRLDTNATFTSIRAGGQALDGIASQHFSNDSTYFLNSMGSNVVPEPGSMAALSIGVLALMRRRAKTSKSQA